MKLQLWLLIVIWIIAGIIFNLLVSLIYWASLRKKDENVTFLAMVQEFFAISFYFAMTGFIICMTQYKKEEGGLLIKSENPLNLGILIISVIIMSLILSNKYSIYILLLLSFAFIMFYTLFY